MKKKRLGEVLCERGQISAADLQTALQDQQGKFIHLGELLMRRGLVSKPDLTAALSEVSSVPYLDCTKLEVGQAILKLIPVALAARCVALPVAVTATTLTIVMTEPQNVELIDELRFKTGLKIVPRFGFQGEVKAAIERLYSGFEVSPDNVQVADDTTGMEFISVSTQERNIEAMREMQAELQQKTKTTPAVHLVASMIKAAAAKGASDIHIEPHQGETAVRFRIDGMLRNYQKIPRALQNTVASRVKIVSDMDISERRTPQDGRFLVRIDGKRIDLRVSTLPTQYGEKVVMRLLEGDTPMKDLATLGFPAEIATTLSRLLQLPQGMILVTGPTGSGKSTTLYSALNAIRRPSINITTVEDPVEYVLAGLNQVQVNVKAGLTFSSCLRSVLRQDPDVVMIGEIRDRETADIAIKAAQTGHLVLSTLHTNDSISAVTRLLDLGVPGFQIASAVTAVLAQRLVRRLCHCRSSSPPSQQYRDSLLLAGALEPAKVEVAPSGCEACDSTGYKGRIGIYEMLVLNDAIRAAARNGNRSDEIRSLAQDNGMKFMQEYALAHVSEGLTTLSEVQRVVPFENASAIYCSHCRRELAAAFVFCPYCATKRLGRESLRPLAEPVLEHEAVSQ
jgi:type IV pilus assembly protein PilB